MLAVAPYLFVGWGTMKKFRRIIAVMVLVCFLIVNPIGENKAEAVAPAVLYAIGEFLVGAGVSVASNLVLEHVARNMWYNNLSDYERRVLELEGGLTEVTVDEVIQKGYKVPAGTNRVYRVAKASLIGGVLSAIAGIGGSYVISYITRDNVSAVEGVTVSNRYGVVGGWSGVVSTGSDYVIDMQGYAIEGKVYAVSGNAGVSGGKAKVVLWMGNTTVLETAWLESGSSGVLKTGAGDMVAYLKFSNGLWRLSYDLVSWTSLGSGMVMKVYINSYDGGAVSGQFSISMSDMGITEYVVTGEVPVSRVEPQVDISQVPTSDDKVIYIYVNDNGTPGDLIDDKVSIGTGTVQADGTEVPDQVPEAPGPNIPTDNPLNRFYNVVSTRWPFSLPWDIGYILGLLNTEAKVPVFDLEYPGFGEIPKQVLHIDLSPFDKYMGVIRWAEYLSFCVGLVLAIRRLYGGAV